MFDDMITAIGIFLKSRTRGTQWLSLKSRIQPILQLYLLADHQIQSQISNDEVITK